MISLLVQAQVEGITQRPFGKNRVQFKDFEWRMKTSPNFEVFYYDYGSGIADFAIVYAENEFDRIATILGHNPSSKTKLFIYNSITDLQQSNVGLENENSRTVGGQTNFIKPKIEIPFTGSLADFKKELSFGIAQIFTNEMMYGGSIREILKNGALLTLPDWFMPGVAAYVAEPWSLEMDDYMRNAIQYRQIKRPHKLTGQEAMFVGHSIWNYIAIKYGEANIASILNLTKIVLDVEKAISSTLGLPYDVFLEEWRKFYLDMSKKALNDYSALEYDTKLKKSNQKQKIFNDVKITPDGKYVAYSENRNGRFVVVVRNLRTMKRKVIFRGGFRMNNQRINERVPLLAWSDDYKLAICYKKSGKTQVKVLQLIGKRKKTVNQSQFAFFNQVTGLDISADGSMLAISSDRVGAADVQAGMNDIYIYDLRQRSMKRLSADLYDDTDPIFVGKSNEVLIFSSNRIADSLNIPPGNMRTINDNYDLFYYNPQESVNKLVRLTQTPQKELQPSFFDEKTILFLSGKTGINNLYSLDLVSKEIRQITNSRQSIKKYSASANTNDFAFRAWDKRKDRLLLKRNFDFAKNEKSILTPRLEFLQQKGLLDSESTQQFEEKKVKEPEKKEDTIPTKPYDPNFIDTDNYQFDPLVVEEVKNASQKRKKEQRNSSAVAGGNTKSKTDVDIRGAYPYEPLFTAESSVTTPIVDPLRGFGLLFEVELSDLLEDHKMKAGLFGLSDLRSSNYFAEYQFLKNRIDLIARYDRKSLYVNQPNVGIAQRYATNRFTLTAAYPFTNSMRVSLTGGYMDRRAVDLLQILRPPQYVSYIYSRAEFNFDNTIPKGLNMVEGTRMKAYYEFNPSFSNINEGFDKILIDIRHYQSISKEIVFATRFSAGRFGGKSPKRYMLGGVDNSFSQSAALAVGGAEPLNLDPNGSPDLLFHEFATNLRGHGFNSLSGKNFLLFNAEIRVPIVKYLFQNSISSNFFKNLQFTAFGDIGSAWNDSAPWNRQNDLNTVIIDNQPFLAIVNNFKSPWLASYGLGARTLFLGYYLKVDAAWTIEDFIASPKPVWLISLGYDF
jgi:Tol biopolymer transport system component